MQDPLGYFATDLDLLELTEVKKSQSPCLLVELDSSLCCSVHVHVLVWFPDPSWAGRAEGREREGSGE